MSEGRLKGKIALITAAAQGIGEEVVALLTKAGAVVVVSDIQDEKGQKIASKIGPSALYLQSRRKKRRKLEAGYENHSSNPKANSSTTI